MLSVKSEDAFLNDQAQAMRAGVYELIARLLAREPDQELLDVLAGIDGVDTSEGKVAMGWELMKQSAQKADLSSVQDEFFSLFVGLGRGELVPFGSWYLTGFLMEKPLAVLRNDLQQLGFERQEGVTESEDHVAALCDVMAILIRGGSEVQISQQDKFFNDQLSPWVGSFFSDMQEAKGASFYRSVGFFGESFFEFEQRLFGMQA
jgi:TorA maturation chaperone TorD